MYGICCVPFFCFLNNRLSKILFSNPFPKKRSDCESQKSGFGFDPKNPPWVWILWIHDPFLDLPPPKNAKSVFGFGNPDLDFLKKMHPKFCTCTRQPNNLSTICLNVLDLPFASSVVVYRQICTWINTKKTLCFEGFLRTLFTVPLNRRTRVESFFLNGPSAGAIFP